jgi:hypothetical protein
MEFRHKIMLSAIVTLGALAWHCGRSEAVQTSLTEGVQASAKPMTLTHVALNGDCCAPAPKCCDVPCIEYRTRRPCHKVCCGCQPPQKMTLTVKDPCCCGCALKVPVCVPACCKGEPCVNGRCAALGRGVVTYSWCCGYKLTVTFKKCGDVMVTYFGS